MEHCAIEQRGRAVRYVDNDEILPPWGCGDYGLAAQIVEGEQDPLVHSLRGTKVSRRPLRPGSPGRPRMRRGDLRRLRRASVARPRRIVTRQVCASTEAERLSRHARR